MDKKVTFSMNENDAEKIKKISAKLDVTQVDIFRAGIKLILKMKVADRQKLLVKKAIPVSKA